ncbi:LOW QUALITY PROTEIN: hypothetical protein CFOL_v3_33685, partial [Cephalotus follicularis]
PPSRGLGPGPPLRTLLQTTIRTPRAPDSQAGLFPVRSPLLRESCWAAFPNNPTRRQRLVVRQGPGKTGLSPSPVPPSRGLGPGPPLRTLLQTTIQTPRAPDSQAELFPVRSPLLRESCLGSWESNIRPFVPRWGGDWGATMRDTQADVPSAWLGAQLAFKDSMVHGILQFTPSIAFSYVLHRCESQDIRCRES